MPHVGERREVILIGHRGFVGSAIAGYLQENGVPFLGVDRANYEASRRQPARYLIDAGGSSDRRLSDADPVASLRAIVEHTLAVISDFPAERYVSLSTVAVYAEPTSQATTREDTPSDPVRLPTHGLFKLVSEALVRRYARSWVIVRLGPMVGPGLRKNSVYDLLERRTLYASPDSTLPYLDTRDVARIVWLLRDQANEAFNLTGRGTVRLADLARDVGVDLTPSLGDLPRDSFDIDISKVGRVVEVPSTKATLERFVSEWRDGLR